MKVGSALSEELQLEVGSPQGAILSPLLFLLYVSDMELWTDIDITGFADDTGAYVDGEEEGKVLKKLEEEALNILEFMASNSLIANEKKTELLIIRPTARKTPDVQIKVGDAEITESSIIRLLGLLIDSDMKWNSQLEQVTNTITTRIGLLRRLRRKLSPSQMTQVAHGLIVSKVRYALPVFGRVRLSPEDPTPKTNTAIQTQLNHLMRLITGNRISDRVNTKELHRTSGVPSLNQLILETTALEMWKTLHYDQPCKALFSRPISNRDGLRKDPNPLRVPPTSSSNQEWFLSKGAKIWNLLPNDCREEPNFQRAKRLVKVFVKNYCDF